MTHKNVSHKEQGSSFNRFGLVIISIVAVGLAVISLAVVANQFTPSFVTSDPVETAPFIPNRSSTLTDNDYAYFTEKYWELAGYPTIAVENEKAYATYTDRYWELAEATRPEYSSYTDRYWQMAEELSANTVPIEKSYATYTDRYWELAEGSAPEYSFYTERYWQMANDK